MNTEFLLVLFPLGFATALMLLAPASLVPALRGSALRPLLTTLLFSFVTTLLLIRTHTHSNALTASSVMSATLALLGSGLAVAPLLDRARGSGMVIGGSIAGMTLASLLLHLMLASLPPVSGVALLQSLLIAATLTGLRGSKLLMLHPERFTGKSVRRLYPFSNVQAAFGWVTLGVTLAGFAQCMATPDRPFAWVPVLLSGAGAALVTLTRTRNHDALKKAGEGFAAGILLALTGNFSMEFALLTSLIGGGFVLTSEAATHALEVDDPQNFFGTLLLPASVGLLLPGFLNTNILSPYALWFYASLGLGLLLPAILWPLVKLTIGLAMPRRI